MKAFSSSTVSLPLSSGADAKPSKKKLLKRFSLKSKKPLSVDISSSSSTSFLASQSTTTLAGSANEQQQHTSSRRTFDMFSSAPSTPRTPKTPKFFSSLAPSRRSTSASMDAVRAPTSSRFPAKDAPPVPAIPKMFLISDEVFVIAAPPKPAQQTVSAPRVSESSSSPSTYSMLSAASSHTSHSWVGNLGSPEEDEVPTFKACKPEPEPEPEQMRSSLDEIDQQIVLNLCLHLCDEKAPASRSESAHKERRARRRSASLRAQAAPVSSSHARMASAPPSLGPLPPQPSQPPTQEVLRKTDQIKKRYSKQSSSPLLSSNSPLIGGSDDTSSIFSSPRPAPGTPKFNSISSLKSLEAGLSLDSKLVKRNHKRSVSKHSIKSVDTLFSVPKEVRLTPGHVATHRDFFEDPAVELVSRFSEDSDEGDDARRLFSSLLSPKLGSVAKFTSTFSSSSHSNSSTISALDMTRLDADGGNGNGNGVHCGSRTPEMVATRNSSSSSSSSLSDLSDFTATLGAAEDPVFDLSRPSMDYATVYALAQKYAAQASSHTTVAPVYKKTPLKSESKTSTSMRTLLNPAASRSHRNLPDPVDRSYHLRKY